MEITVVGAGAVGGTVGAYLIRSGHAVTFVDVAAGHVRAINRRGLTVEGFVPAFTVRARALLPDELRGPLGTVFLAVKAMHTEAATRRIAPHLAPDGYIVSFQNGFNEDRIASVVGRERTVGAFVNFGADYLGPGRIFYGGAGSLYLGELDGRITGRLRALQAALLAFLPNTRVTSNIWGYLWGKHAYGALLTATALVDAAIADVLAEPAYRPALANLAAEVLALAAAERVRPEAFDGFEPQAFAFGPGRSRDRIAASLDALVAFNRRSLKAKSGIWRDLVVRRRTTEVGAGYQRFQELARRHGMAIPLLDATCRMILEIEAGRRPMAPDNLRELAAVNARVYGDAEREGEAGV